jgi:hypothetical protein
MTERYVSNMLFHRAPPLTNTLVFTLFVIAVVGVLVGLSPMMRGAQESRPRVSARGS